MRNSTDSNIQLNTGSDIQLINGITSVRPPSPSQSTISRRIKLQADACICVILTLWQFAFILLFIVNATVYLRPALICAEYHQTLCHTESNSHASNLICSCGEDCKSIYPCNFIHVFLNHSDGHRWTVGLYSSVFHQKNVFYERYEGLERCSVRHCDRNHSVNLITVDDFVATYGTPGTSFPCYYNNKNPSAGAVVELDGPSFQQVLHALLWPILALLVGTILFVMFCRRCRHSFDSKPLKDQRKAEKKVKWIFKRKNENSSSTAISGIADSISDKERERLMMEGTDVRIIADDSLMLLTGTSSTQSYHHNPPDNNPRTRHKKKDATNTRDKIYTMVDDSPRRNVWM